VKSYDVKFRAIPPGKARTSRTYEDRWKVGQPQFPRALTRTPTAPQTSRINWSTISNSAHDRAPGTARTSNVA